MFGGGCLRVGLVWVFTMLFDLWLFGLLLFMFSFIVDSVIRVLWCFVGFWRLGLGLTWLRVVTCLYVHG